MLMKVVKERGGIKVRKKVRLGIIGCGWAARDLYAPYFKYLENGELVACMDINEKNTKFIQNITGCKKIYANLDDILGDKEIEAVLVLTPTNLHVEHVVKAAEANKHVYCEKPMARTISECDRMIEACRKNKVKLQVGFMKRFNRSFLFVKDLIDRGEIGDIFEMRAIWDNARAGATTQNYRHRIESGGGFLQEDGSHPIDICRWFLGDVEEVTANILLVMSNRIENEDVANVLMKHKSGAISSLHITMLTHCIGEESYQLFGLKGTLIMQWLYHSTHSIEPAIIKIWEKSKKVTDYTLTTSWNPIKEISENWQYLNEIRHFCDCIINDKIPSVTGEDGRAVVEIINAAYISASEGKVIKLPLKEPPDFRKIFTEMKDQSRWQLQDDETWWSWY